MGRFSEPVIVSAAIAESICAVSLFSGLWAVFCEPPALWRGAFIGNLVALASVLLGIGALAAGRVPRTISNDNLHRAMLPCLGYGIATMLSYRLIARQEHGIVDKTVLVEKFGGERGKLARIKDCL